jgi:hypothetical protein
MDTLKINIPFRFDPQKARERETDWTYMTTYTPVTLTEFRRYDIWVLFITDAVPHTGRSQFLASRRYVE